MSTAARGASPATQLARTTAALMLKQLQRHNSLNALKDGSNNTGIPEGVDSEWKEALEIEDPPMLPIMACGPPRLGKSALITLMSGFAIKLGATVVLGVGPNKTIPLAEMLGKYTEKLQYTPLSRAEIEQQRKHQTQKDQDAAGSSSQQSGARAPPPSSIHAAHAPARARAARTERARARARARPYAAALPRSRPRVLLCCCAERAAPAQKRMRTTHQGLEIATTRGSLPQRDGSRQALWARSYAHDNDILGSKTGPQWYLWYMEQHKTLTHPELMPLFGRFEKEMQQSVARPPSRRDGTPFHLNESEVKLLPKSPVRLYMFSETVVGDVQAALDVATSVYKNTDNVQSWCFFIHDEAQVAFAKNPSDTRIRPGQQQKKPVPIKEGATGWLNPPDVLRLHRETYPLALNLKMVVSATLLPTMLESRLYGEHGLVEYSEAMPSLTPDERNKLSEEHAAAALEPKWNVWHDDYDKQLFEAALLAERRTRFTPLLLPPRGRLFYCSDEAGQRGVKKLLPEWVKTENTPTAGSNGRPSYYGTMEHFEVWDGGWLTKTALTEEEKTLTHINEKMLEAFTNALNKDINKNEGKGKYCPGGMWQIDMSHIPNTKALRYSLTRLQTAYAETEQYIQQQTTGAATELASYRRSMATPVDYPTEAFVKTMLLVKARALGVGACARACGARRAARGARARCVCVV